MGRSHIATTPRIEYFSIFDLEINIYEDVWFDSLSSTNQLVTIQFEINEHYCDISITYLFFFSSHFFYISLWSHTHTRLFDSTYSPIFPRCASHFEFNAYKSFDLIYHLFVYVVQPFFPPRSFSSSCVFPSNCVKFM